MSTQQIHLFQDSGQWVARHLDYHNMVAQGNTPQEAVDSLERLCMGQIHLDIQSITKQIEELFVGK